jgi:hypothetical protein
MYNAYTFTQFPAFPCCRFNKFQFVLLTQEQKAHTQKDMPSLAKKKKVKMKEKNTRIIQDIYRGGVA